MILKAKPERIGNVAWFLKEVGPNRALTGGMWPGLWGFSFGRGRHIVGMRQTLRQETRKRLQRLCGRLFCTHSCPGTARMEVGVDSRSDSYAENQVMRAGMPRRCPGSLKSVHGCLSVPAATTGCRHCPAKGAGVSGYGVSFTGSCTDSVLPGSGHPREAQWVPPFVTYAHSSPRPGQRSRPAGARLSYPSESKAAAGLLGRKHLEMSF